MSMMLKDLAEALGVSAATVTRDAASGMPTHSVDAAAAWRREHRRPRHRAQQPPEGATAAGPPQLPGAAAPAPDDNGGDYWASRARRERAEAELAELKLAEQQGVLVRADDVRAAYAKRAASLRESLLQMPSRLASVLAAETTQARCHDILQAEVHAILSGLVEQWRGSA